MKALQLLPNGCEALLIFENYPEFSNALRNKSIIWQEIQHVKALKPLERHFHFFDSLTGSSEFLSGLLDHNLVYFASYPGQQLLIACNLKSSADEAEASAQVEKFSSALQSFQLHAKVQQGVVAIGSSEEILGRLFSKDGKLISDPAFSALRQSASYSGTMLFVGAQPGHPFSNSYSFFTIKPDRIILNGVQVADSMAACGDASAPASTSTDFLYQIPLLCNAFEALVQGRDTADVVTDAWWREVNERAMFNARKVFLEHCGGIAVKMLMPSGNFAVMLECRDSLRVAQLIPFFCDSIMSPGQQIFKLNAHPGARSISDFKVGGLSCLYFSGSNLVFTASENDARIFQNAFQNRSSIMDNKSFSHFAARNFNSDFHCIRYRLLNGLNEGTVDVPVQVANSDLPYLKNLSHFSYVGLHRDRKTNFRVNLSYSQDHLSSEPGLLWTMKTDSAVINGPYLFKNHLTGGTEILLQTSGADLCLYNAAGKLQWKKKLSEPIRSAIFTVDAFKNKKYQMLFSSDHFLHLIDRNGNYVQGYPLKLPARATNPLTVLDYEGNNDLRLLIACADKKIYNYSIWGIKLEGFRPLATDAEVTLPVKYCRVGLSDYLVTADRKGKIYAFSRRGEGRIDFSNKLVEDAAHFELQTGNHLANTFIVYYDHKGHLIDKISLTDKKDVYKTSEQSGNSQCIFADFDNNKTVDAIVAGSSMIEVYDMNGAKIYDIKLREEINLTGMAQHRTGSRNFIDLHDNQLQKCLLYEVGEKGFRKFDCSRPALICDLYNDGKSYLLLVSGGELKCLRL